ncbi:trimeric intracellular cation channel family protein [Halobacillus shinanisalinarum]|uniref:Trimeric intracellular cation channel family protein n=1 Tax=Halobacillus shinanisalinarum TaxID=2932258 RepID=A0ABY4H506_9BACI|nr:trimeric intracellular cation channel family protein [Halobacillus shinanisalinarum]UOQ95238.1 trimeric intracellular cation channel family protein [Halobacillus shinanisalinarum]
MSFETLTIIAVSAFAFSGAIVALSERYDIFGTFMLGIATPFAGGIIRNIAMDVPVLHVWEQGHLFYVAIGTIAVVYFFPKRWVMFWDRWNIYLDAIGLSAFALQGATFAINHDFPLGGIIFAAILTGVGGGMTRDVLAQRRPMVLHQEIYAVWAMVVGLLVGLEIVDLASSWQKYTLFVVIIGCRVLSYHLGWHLRFRDLYRL